MPDLFFESGEDTSRGVPAPFIQGSYFPAIDMIETSDGYGEYTPLGGGALANRYSEYGLAEEIGATEASLDRMVGMLTGSASPNISYNFTGLIGPPGVPGPPGPAGLFIMPPIPSISSAANPSFGLPIVSASITWTDDSPSPGYVAWSAGSLVWGNATYAIAAGNSNGKYIYWDSASPSTFQGTNTNTDAVSSGRFLIAHNASGTAYPIYAGAKLYEGQLLRDATIAANQIASSAITAAKTSLAAIDPATGNLNTLTVDTAQMIDGAIEAAKTNLAGINSTTGYVAVSDQTAADLITSGINSHAVTLINPGKVLISGGVNLSDWSHGSDATLIDGGDIYAHSVIASKLSILAHLLVGGTWTDDSPGAGSVAWAGFSVEYDGTTYAISDDNTANKYIWWDKTSPTVFSTSATKPTMLDEDALICINDGGTHYEAWRSTQIHGSTITTGSVNSDEIAANAVTATKINVIGLDGATGQILVADETQANLVAAGINSHATTLINAGKIVISGATNLDDWSKTGDTTKIDGGKISTDTITATQIAGNTITATEIVAGTITAASAILADAVITTAKIDNLQVATGKIADSATRVVGEAYDATENVTGPGGPVVVTTTITSEGGVIRIEWETEITDWQTGKNQYIQIREDTVEIDNITITGDGVYQGSKFAQPGSGSVTYDVRCRSDSYSGPPYTTATDSWIRVEEDKGK
jgi:hypothetical protein